MKSLKEIKIKEAEIELERNQLMFNLNRLSPAEKYGSKGLVLNRDIDQLNGYLTALKWIQNT